MSFFLFLLETNYSSSVRLLLVDFFFFLREIKNLFEIRSGYMNMCWGNKCRSHGPLDEGVSEDNHVQ